MSGRTTNRALLSILTDTNDVQGGWVSKREVYLHLVAHAGMETSEDDQALYQLRKREKIDVDEGRHRPALSVDRPKHPGER